MKKHLLSAALLLAGVAVCTPSIEAKSAMDSSLKLLWMNTDVASLQLDARQGVARGDKFYLQNGTTKKIEIWDATGKVGEIESGAGKNITLDDAGNILVRMGEFPNPYTYDPELRIIPADGSAAKDMPLKQVSTTGRVDFWGHVGGDVMSKDGGVLLMGTQWTGKMSELWFANGAQDLNNSTMHTYMNPLKIGGQITTTSLLSAWKDGDDMLMAVFVPNAATGTQTSDCNSIQKMVYDEDLNIVHDSYFITPNHNVCTGFYIFSIGTQKYIVYSTGSNRADGFSIAKLATKADFAVEDGDQAYRVATKYAETKEDGNAMYSNNSFYGNHFTVEANDANSVFIYQYFPKGYIAKYQFTPATTSVEGVEEEVVNNVYTLDGKIVVEGEASDIAVYNVNGALVSAGKAEVEVPAGAYVVTVNGKASKVLVR